VFSSFFFVWLNFEPLLQGHAASGHIFFQKKECRNCVRPDSASRCSCPDLRLADDYDCFYRPLSPPSHLFCQIERPYYLSFLRGFPYWKNLPPFNLFVSIFFPRFYTPYYPCNERTAPWFLSLYPLPAFGFRSTRLSPRFELFFLLSFLFYPFSCVEKNPDILLFHDFFFYQDT